MPQCIIGSDEISSQLKQSLVTKIEKIMQVLMIKSTQFEWHNEVLFQKSNL